MLIFLVLKTPHFHFFCNTYNQMIVPMTNPIHQIRHYIDQDLPGIGILDTVQTIIQISTLRKSIKQMIINKTMDIQQHLIMHELHSIKDCHLVQL